MNLVSKGKRLLIENGYTFVALKDEEVYSSCLHGIEPIMSKVIVSNDYFKDYVVIDRVIGRSVAILLIRSGIRAVHTVVLSEPAKRLFDDYQINYSYDELVPYITNHSRDGICLMESSVLEVDYLDSGFQILCQQIKEAIYK